MKKKYVKPSAEGLGRVYVVPALAGAAGALAGKAAAVAVVSFVGGAAAALGAKVFGKDYYTLRQKSLKPVM